MQDRATGEYSQGEIMASQVMAETLEYQALAIWEKERMLWEASGLHRFRNVIDVGCGTGQISSRLAQNYPYEEVVGVDLVPNHIAYANQKFQSLPHLRFIVGDGGQLDFPDHHFDIAVNRHVIQAIPQPEPLIREMWRIVRPGGMLYFLAEDYAMIHATDTLTDRNWFAIASGLLSQGTDLLIGRKLPQILRTMNLPQPEVHYLNVGTSNTPREHMAGIMRTWRDGYTEFLGQNTSLGPDGAADHFERLIRCCLDPNLDLVWHIPIIMVAKPE